MVDVDSHDMYDIQMATYFGTAWSYSHMVGYAGSPTRTVYVDMTLTQSKVKVNLTGLLNFRQLVKPCMMAAMTAAPLRGFLVKFLDQNNLLQLAIYRQWRSTTVAIMLTALTHSSYSSVNIPTLGCKCKRVVTVVDHHCLEWNTTCYSTPYIIVEIGL